MIEAGTTDKHSPEFGIRKGVRVLTPFPRRGFGMDGANVRPPTPGRWGRDIAHRGPWGCPGGGRFPSGKHAQNTGLCRSRASEPRPSIPTTGSGAAQLDPTRPDEPVSPSGRRQASRSACMVTTDPRRYGDALTRPESISSMNSTDWLLASVARRRLTYLTTGSTCTFEY
eukprot:478099-Prymnesium_polylepis.1